METRQEVGERLERLRHAAGDPSFKRLERVMVRAIGLAAPTAEKIRLYHRGEGPEPDVMDIDLLVELAIFYGVALDELSVVVAERARARVERQSVLLGGNRDDAGSEVTDTRRQSREPIAA
jgi:hypothetical protein